MPCLYYFDNSGFGLPWPVRDFGLHFITITAPAVTLKSLTDILDQLDPLSDTTMQDVTLRLWIQETNQVFIKWGVISSEVQVAPGETANFSFEWPDDGVKPSNQAQIYLSIEMVLKRMANGQIIEYPVYGFPVNTQLPQKPDTPPLLEVNGHEGKVGEYLLFGFDSPGRLIGNLQLNVSYPEPPEEIALSVDIKPGSCPNAVNRKSKGVLPVAILGTPDFDATFIDPESIVLWRDGSGCCGVTPVRWGYEDVATSFTDELCQCHDLNGDGYTDMTLKFDTRELAETLQLDEVAGETIPLALTGKLKTEWGNNPIKGKDCIWIVDNSKKE